MKDKETLIKERNRGFGFFLNNNRNIKTPIYSRFIKEVISPLSEILRSELSENEKPEIDRVLSVFSGFIINIKE